MTLPELATEMKNVADQQPFDPLRTTLPDDRYVRSYQMGPHLLTLIFLRTKLHTGDCYQLWIGSQSGIFGVPDDIIRQVRKAFLFNSVESPSQLVNTRQFNQFLE